MNYEYDAFISYRHLPNDKAIAERLQVLLETYRPPRGGQYANTNRISRIFRDESELPTSGDLGADIESALRSSRYLIIICSEETKDSVWCMEEIRIFKKLHKGSNANILPLLIEGEPEVSFPEPIRFETRSIAREDGGTESAKIEIEPRAADIRANGLKRMKKRLSTEFLRIAAPILGCSYDDLYRRHQKRFIRRVISYAAIFAAVMMMASGYVIHTRNQIAERDRIAAENDRIAAEQRIIAQGERTMRSLNVAEDLIASGDKVLASALICELAAGISEPNEYTSSEIERLLSQSTYVPKYTQYATLAHNAQITCSFFGDDDTLYSATAIGTVFAWDVKNGALKGQGRMQGKVLAMAEEEGILYAVTAEQSIAIWDTFTWEKLDEFSFYDGSFNLPLYSVADIMVHGSSLYIAEDDFRYSIRKVDITSRQDELLYNDDPATSAYFGGYAFDKKRKRIVMGEGDYSIIHDLETGVISNPDIWIRAAYYNAAVDEYIFVCKENRFSSEEFICIFTPDLTESVRSMELTAWDGNRISANGRYLMLDGSYDAETGGYKSYSIFDLETMTFLGEISGEQYSSVNFFDGEHLIAIKRDNSQGQQTIGWNLAANSARAITNPALNGDSLINEAETVKTVSNVDEIYLFSLKDAMTEEPIPASIVQDELFGKPALNIDLNTISQKYDVGGMGGFGEPQGYRLDSLTRDGRYALISLMTDNAPPHTSNSGNGGYVSYWVADCQTGECLYNAYLPVNFSDIEIKDDTMATLQIGSSFIYDIDMKTGETIASVKIDAPFTEGFISANHDADRVLFWGKDEYMYRGVLASKSTGKTLMEFSEDMREAFISFSKDGTRLYRYTLEDIEADEKTVSEAFAMELPDYEKLMELAQKQIAGRYISADERARLGLD